MKKIFFMLGLLFALNSIHANTSDLFSIDKNKIDNEFNDLNILEKYVDVNNLSLKEVQLLKNQLLENILIDSEHITPLTNNDYDLKWILAPIAVGVVCCGTASIALLFMASETTDALLGCCLISANMIDILTIFGTYKF